MFQGVLGTEQEGTQGRGSLASGTWEEFRREGPEGRSEMEEKKEPDYGDFRSMFPGVGKSVIL